jgi:hypothetical protein
MQWRKIPQKISTSGFCESWAKVPTIYIHTYIHRYVCTYFRDSVLNQLDYACEYDNDRHCEHLHAAIQLQGNARVHACMISNLTCMYVCVSAGVGRANHSDAMHLVGRASSHGQCRQGC